MATFVTTSSYALWRVFGPEEASRRFQLMCQKPDLHSLHAAHLVHRLLELDEIALFQHTATQLPKVRSRCADAALQSGAARWLTVDDDIECDTGTLKRLLQLTDTPEVERIAALPYLVRGTAEESRRVCCSFAGPVERVDGVLCRRVERIGAGLLVVTRAALQRVTKYFASTLAFVDDDGATKTALFHMLLHPNEQWLGEDLSFIARAQEAGIPIYAPMQGTSVHDGRTLVLDDLQQLDDTEPGR
jgi:hypothetical protein